MFVARTLARRLWLSAILILTSLKLAVARIIPDATEGSASPIVKPRIKTGRILALAALAGKQGTSGTQYGLEATGTFPFVRVVALVQRSIPVPVEVAPVPVLSQKGPTRLAGVPYSAAQKRGVSTKKRSGRLNRRLQTDHEKPFCFPANSQSCLNCPTCCIICGSCTSSGSCSSCGGCACGCGSCTSSSACTSCTPG